MVSPSSERPTGWARPLIGTLTCRASTQSIWVEGGILRPCQAATLRDREMPDANPIPFNERATKTQGKSCRSNHESWMHILLLLPLQLREIIWCPSQVKWDYEVLNTHWTVLVMLFMFSGQCLLCNYRVSKPPIHNVFLSHHILYFISEQKNIFDIFTEYTHVNMTFYFIYIYIHCHLYI